MSFTMSSRVFFRLFSFSHFWASSRSGLAPWLESRLGTYSRWRKARVPLSSFLPCCWMQPLLKCALGGTSRTLCRPWCLLMMSAFCTGPPTLWFCVGPWALGRWARLIADCFQSARIDGDPCSSEFAFSSIKDTFPDQAWSEEVLATPWALWPCSCAGGRDWLNASYPVAR